MLERSQIATSFHAPPGSPPVAWRIEPGLTGYEEAVAFMEQRAADIRDGKEAELVWLVEHPPLYTAGTSAEAEDLLDPTACRCSGPAAAANIPITGRASASPM